MSYKNQPMNLDQAIVIISELEKQLEIETEACELLGNDVKNLVAERKELRQHLRAYEEALEFIDNVAVGGYKYNDVEIRMILKAREVLKKVSNEPF